MRTIAIALAALLLLPGCEKLMRNMYDQPRYKPLAESPLFPDGSSARLSPPGTVPAANGTLADTSSGRLGAVSTARPRRTLALLKRGQERFDIYCAPCHSPVGDGDGMVVRRGFPRPPSYHIERLRAAPDQYFYDVITNGYGVMHSYAGRVPPEDRWAIVGYIRALQLSQHAQMQERK